MITIIYKFSKLLQVHTDITSKKLVFTSIKTVELLSTVLSVRCSIQYRSALAIPSERRPFLELLTLPDFNLTGKAAGTTAGIY
jgi:hypothetical protein